MSRIRRRGTPDNPVYEARTKDVVVRVAPAYMAEQSRPEEGQWLWSYVVEIENHGTQTVTLMSRHWIITDANNQVQEVRGPGVVGEQPTLEPKQSFEYTSGTALATSVGTMRGTYQMLAEDGTKFDADIPEFTLSVPRVLH